MGFPLSDSDAYQPVQVAHRKIKLKKQYLDVASRIAGEFCLSPLASRVLAARGYVIDQNLKTFLNPTLKDGLSDPSQLKNLDAACDLIAKVVKDRQAIAICCDFDVDGLSGGSQVQHFFSVLGVKSKVFVPDRFEDGYGLNEKMIRSIAGQGFKLVITIDYGTTNLRELDLARKLGLKTIVIDHHHVGNLKPSADIFINPNQKGCNFANKVLCASGLAWHLLLGLKKILPEAKELDVRSYLDLACLGTICDMVPLVGVNRIIAKRGLELLSQTERLGLVALKNVAGINGNVACSDVGFGIGPRINAAGRLVHGDLVIELLTTGDSLQAAKLAKRLNKLNLERQETEAVVKDSAIEQVKSRGALPAGLVVWDESYHTGVIGIVAQRLVETFYRPAVVLGVDEKGVYKGSVRGIKGFNVVEALAGVSEYLLKYGGHEGAGGLSVREENLDDFEQAFVKECEQRLESLVTDPVAEADAEASLEELTPDLVAEFKRFAPFGMGNPNPQVLVKKLKVSEVRVLKDAHLKASLSDGKRYISGLMWRNTQHPALKVGNLVDIVCRPEVSNYMGRAEMQATLQAVQVAV